MHREVLITTPDLRRLGGIEQYCRNLQAHLRVNASFLRVGPRYQSRSLPIGALRFLADTVRFAWQLTWSKPSLVQLNPSLIPRPLIREGAFLLLAKARRVPVLVFFHGWDPGAQEAIRRRWLRLFGAVFFRADGFVVLARNFKQSLIEMGCRRPIHLASTSVSEDLFEDERAPHAGFRILFLSRVNRAKGIYETYEMYKLLRQTNAEVSLVIAGEGADLEPIRRAAKRDQTPGVEFLGYVQGESKRMALARSDVFVLLSRHEGMPISLLEAMACGLPIITRPVGAIAEFFRDGRMGFLVTEPGPEAAAQIVLKLMRDGPLRRRIGEFNRSFARERFGAARCAARLEAIYAQTIAGPSQSRKRSG